MTVAAGDRDRGRGPVHREFAGPALHRQRGDQAQRVLRRGCLDRPVERSAEVVDVARDDAAPLEVLSAPQVRTGRLGHGDVVVGVATSHRDRVAARVEALPRVLADGLEQPVAHPAVVVSSTTTSDLSTSWPNTSTTSDRVELVVGQDRLRRRRDRSHPRTPTAVQRLRSVGSSRS